MWTEFTAAGQSLWSWLAVNAALWLWLMFYQRFTPDQVWAIRSAKVGIAINAAVILTVFYFRYIA
jgi:hypothetical protein